LNIVSNEANRNQTQKHERADEKSYIPYIHPKQTPFNVTK